MRISAPFSTRRVLFLALVLAVAGITGGAAAGRGPLLGGYSKIKNVKDPHVVEIGKFAVAEDNKNTGGNLTFLRVDSGRQQVVAGMNYDLRIAAADGGVRRRYAAVVYERAWENYRSLTSFKLIN